MPTLRPLTLMAWIMLWSAPGAAVDGTYVNTRNGTDSLTYYGTIDGELWRHDIKADVVVAHTRIYNGPASRPAISPDGKRVAFIKKTGSATGKVVLIDINGAGETLLADCLRNSLIDFPHPDWVYFTMGGFYESTSGLLKRVNLKTKVVETVMQIKGADGNNTRVAQIQISNDLTRAVVRTGDSESRPDGAIVALSLTTDAQLDHVIGPKYSCGAGLFADGQHAMDGWNAHDGFDIRRYSDARVVKSFSNAAAFNWSPNRGAGDPVDTAHAIFNTGAATNSDRWMCIVTGGSRNLKWHSVLLINWQDERCIFVTKGLPGPWDHGDFWVGSPDTPPPPLPSAQNQPPKVSAGGDQQGYVDTPLTLVGSFTDDGLPAGSTPKATWSVAGDDPAAQVAEQNSPITTVKFSKPGIYTLRLTVSDGELSASDELEVTVSAAQRIDLISPLGGEKWAIGSTQYIKWTTVATDDVYILISFDGGVSWETIIASVDTSDSARWGNFPFEVPDRPTDRALLRIEAYMQGEAEPPQSDFFTIGVAQGDAATERPHPDAGVQGSVDVHADTPATRNDQLDREDNASVTLGGGCSVRPGAARPCCVIWIMLLISRLRIRWAHIRA